MPRAFRPFPWRGRVIVLRADEPCRVCGARLAAGTEARYHPFAIGGMHSCVACGFRTEAECRAEGVPFPFAGAQ